MLVPRDEGIKVAVVERLQQERHPVLLDKKRGFIYVTKAQNIPVGDIILALHGAGLTKVSVSVYLLTSLSLSLWLSSSSLL